MASTAASLESPTVVEVVKERSRSKCSLSDFDLLEVIGNGRFGKVWRAYEKKRGYFVAIKVLKKKPIEENDLMRQTLHELFIHSVLDHPNVIKLLTTFHDEQNICLVLEYAPNGSLFQILQDQPHNRFEERIAAKYCRQTADAVLYVHSKRYFHGDLKPENILLDAQKNVKLSDFGLSWFYCSGFRDRGYCGTVDYLAPELIRNEFYDFSIDQWSIGVLIYELLVGKSPFCNKKRKVVENKILNLDYKFPKIVKEDAQDLIKRLLVIKPSQRLPMEDLLLHPWFTRCISESLP